MAKELLSVTKEVEDLVQVVVDTATEVHSGKGAEDAHAELDRLREDWTSKVQFLSETISELTHWKKFASTAGEHAEFV